jgi:hypothetical protein
VIEVKDCVFTDNSAPTGSGAILNVENSFINMTGSTFMRNKAINGGVLDIDCPSGSIPPTCGVIATPANVFIGNEAIVDGGVFRYNNVIPNSPLTENTFTDNKAAYGNEFAGKAVKMQVEVTFLLVDSGKKI